MHKPVQELCRLYQDYSNTMWNVDKDGEFYRQAFIDCRGFRRIAELYLCVKPHKNPVLRGLAFFCDDDYMDAGTDGWPLIGDLINTKDNNEMPGECSEGRRAAWSAPVTSISPHELHRNPDAYVQQPSLMTPQVSTKRCQTTQTAG